MIVNLAEATRLVLSNANLNEDDVRYVTFYNNDEEELQYCSFDEFMDTAQEINYDENDVLIPGRRVIDPHLSIVAESWWLRRSYDNEEVDTWVFQEIPKPFDELMQGIGELDERYIIEELDVMSSEYKELVEDDNRDYPFAKETSIIINDKEYTIIDDDGIDKVMNDNNGVAIIVAMEGVYWNWSSSPTKDIGMLFHPQLVKMILEGTYLESDEFNTNYIEDHYGLNTNAFSNKSYKSLTVVFITRGTEFNIATSTSPSTGTMCEYIEPKKVVNWLTA